MIIFRVVKSLFNSVQFDDIIWGSDLNWDPSRNTQFSRTVKAFIQECELVSVWDSFPVPYTHVHTDKSSKSILDHFLVSPKLLELIEDCGIIERGDNQSRHCPIWLKLKLGELPLRKPVGKWLPQRPDWSNSTVSNRDDYSRVLDSKLRLIHENTAKRPNLLSSLVCEDVHCKNVDHSIQRTSCN